TARLVLMSLLLTLACGCRTFGLDGESGLLDGDERRVEVKALFLPGDPLLATVGEWIAGAKSRVDIAIYMMDTDHESNLIREVRKDSAQSRIRSGRLKIRMIFEGSQGTADAEKRSRALEDLGIDVRNLTSSRKVHHKFA